MEEQTFDNVLDYFGFITNLSKILCRHVNKQDFHSNHKANNDEYYEKTGRVSCGNTMYKKVEGLDPDVEVYEIELGRSIEETKRRRGDID